MRISSLAIGVGALASLLAGCQPGRQAAGPRPGSPTATDRETKTDKGVTIEDDKEKSRVRFIGLKGHHGTDAANVYLIRSWVDRKSLAVTHQLYVGDHYLAANPRGWSQARGEKNESLPVTKIELKTENCSPQGCPRLETFGARLTDATLRAAVRRGYRVTFTADDGTSQAVTLSPEQIQAQFDAIDEKVAAMPKPAAPKPRKRASGTSTNAPVPATAAGAAKAAGTKAPAPRNTGY